MGGVKHCPMRVGQGEGLRGRWESLQIGKIKRAFKSMIYSKLSLDVLPLCWSRFWEFWANSLKSRLQFNHVPVHETHSTMVRKITTTSTTPSLNRIGSLAKPVRARTSLTSFRIFLAFSCGVHNTSRYLVSGTFTWRRQPLSFGEIQWFDVPGQVRRCDWPRNATFCMCQLKVSRLRVF
jgi:hypothetical protein